MRTTFLLFTYLLVSCNFKENRKIRAVKPANNLTVNNKEQKAAKLPDRPTMWETTRNLEVLYSETKGSETTEKIIPEKQLKIKIVKSYLDTYVTDDPLLKTISNYRDVQVRLTIKQYSQVLIDTILKKEQFSKFVEHIDKSLFQVYQFDELYKNRIRFIGMIGLDQLASEFKFLHYFDLEDKKLKFDVEESDESGE